jgi:hypothetical protein
MKEAVVLGIIAIRETRNFNSAIIAGMTEMIGMTGEMGSLRRRDADWLIG